MVDINLLKDDDDEEKPFGHDDEEFKDDLGGDVNFEGDLTEPVMGEDDLLGDVEDIPDIDAEEAAVVPDEDYSYISPRSKKAPVWLWGLLALVCVGTAVYLFILQPRFKKEPPLIERPERKPLITQVRPDSGQTVSPAKPLSEEPIAEDVKPPEGFELTDTIIPIAKMASASKAVVDDLARSEQFATLFMNGDQVFVEYVSKTPGVVKVMGPKIQTLLGLSSYTASPEERHRTSGEITYWGVISGRFPSGPGEITAGGPNQFSNVQAFVNAVRSQLGSHQLTMKDSQNLTSVKSDGFRQSCVRIKIEGGRENALAYLSSLTNFKGNFGISKLIMAPVSISDFQASRIKMVIDFILQLG